MHRAWPGGLQASSSGPRPRHDGAVAGVDVDGHVDAHPFPNAQLLGDAGQAVLIDPVFEMQMRLTPGDTKRGGGQQELPAKGAQGIRKPGIGSVLSFELSAARVAQDWRKRVAANATSPSATRAKGMGSGTEPPLSRIVRTADPLKEDGALPTTLPPKVPGVVKYPALGTLGINRNDAASKPKPPSVRLDPVLSSKPQKPMLLVPA